METKIDFLVTTSLGVNSRHVQDYSVVFSSSEAISIPLLCMSQCAIKCCLFLDLSETFFVSPNADLLHMPLLCKQLAIIFFFKNYY